MRAHINKSNAIVISQNMAIYYFWHSLVSINAVKLANTLLESVDASAASTKAIVNPLTIGLKYMTVIGLAFRLTLALAKTNDSLEGKWHGIYTYAYNQEFTGVLTNRQSLLCMMALGLLHNCFVNKQSLADNGLREYLFKMLLPMLVGYKLDTLVDGLHLRERFTSNKMAAYAFVTEMLIWGGLGARGAEKVDHSAVQNGIHAGL
jgi:hypothetical protein